MAWDKDLQVVKRMVEDYKGLLALQGILERLAGAEHLAKQLETTAEAVQAKRAEIQALDVQYAERVRALDVAANKEQERLEASLAPLKAQAKQIEAAGAATVAGLEAKAAGLRDQIQRLIGERAQQQGEVAGLEKKLTDLNAAWEKVRQKVGAA